MAVINMILNQSQIIFSKSRYQGAAAANILSVTISGSLVSVQNKATEPLPTGYRYLGYRANSACWIALVTLDKSESNEPSEPTCPTAPAIGINTYYYTSSASPNSCVCSQLRAKSL